MPKEVMTCPTCGGTIEVEHGTEGSCDTCETRLVEGRIVESPEGIVGTFKGLPFVAARGVSKHQSKEQFLEALNNESIKLYQEGTVISEPHLYLTQAQYDEDPEFWKRMLRVYNLPETNVIIIPDEVTD